MIGPLDLKIARRERIPPNVEDAVLTALEKLGFGPCYHMTEVFAHPEHADFWVAAWRGEPVDWDGVLGDYEATVDAWIASGIFPAWAAGNEGPACSTLRACRSWNGSISASIPAAV